MTNYQHTWVDCEPCELPAGKVVCVGRNYAAHAKELNNPVPKEPLLFIKPSTSLSHISAGITLAAHRGEVHFETEIALLVGETIGPDHSNPTSAVAGIGLALDLTLRQLQTTLKEKGHPWERAKAFDGACPITPFTPRDQCGEWQALAFELQINGETRQRGLSSDMLMSVPDLLRHIAQSFTLLPGDVVLTGTPAGVGVLIPGDHLRLTGVDGRHWTSDVI